MIQAIKNWFFTQLVLSRMPPKVPIYVWLSNVEEEHFRHFYVAKKLLRERFPSVDLIEIADGILIVVKGRCVARVEV